MVGEKESEVNYSDEEKDDKNKNETLGAFGVTESVAHPQSTVENVRSQAEVSVKTVLNNNTKIQFRNYGTTDEWKEAVVVNKAGKYTGKYKMWMNIHALLIVIRLNGNKIDGKTRRNLSCYHSTSITTLCKLKRMK